MKREPESLLPLPAASFQILIALSDGEKHGYAIMREVEEQTRSAMKLGPGTLYGSLKRLLKDDLIEEFEPRGAAPENERRRYYRLTTFGQRVAAAELARLESMVRWAKQKKVSPR